MTPDFVTGIKWYLVFLFSSAFHEAAHAWMALKLGDDTAYRGGQVTLDPTPHLRREPIGMLLVPILSYLSGGWMIGWASAPYNPTWALEHPRRAAWMSLAGPGANLVLVLLATTCIRAGMAVGVFDAPSRIGWSSVTVATQEGLYPFLATIVSLVFSLNLLLCVFNLLPLPPLDGSSLPFLLLSGSAAQRYATLVQRPGLALISLLIAWRMFEGIYPPIQLWVINLLYWGQNYG